MFNDHPFVSFVLFMVNILQSQYTATTPFPMIFGPPARHARTSPTTKNTKCTKKAPFHDAASSGNVESTRLSLSP